MANDNETISTFQDAWSSLSSDQKAIVGALATVDAAGKVLALRDLAKTPSKRVRGPKWFWAPVIAAVNTLGWATYFALGKKR